MAVILAGLLAATAVPFISKAARQSSAPQTTKLKSERGLFVPGEILVRFRSEPAATAKEQARVALDSGGGEIPLSIERFDGSELVEGLRLARVAPEETLRAIDALKEQPDVLYAEPNFIRRKSALPNDTQFNSQWALRNFGQTGGKPAADINAEFAWLKTTGSRSVVVGVVDEGIDINHPDLRDNIWRNPAEIPGNNLDDDGNGFVDDVNGYDFFHNDATVYDGHAGDNDTDAHGTHVAGTIGATGNNGQGVTGVNWQTSLMSLKILGTDTEAAAPSSVSITVRAYGYAKAMRELWASTNGARGANVRVLNNSYGGYGRSQAELDAINALGGAGILFVAAAGNDSTSSDRAPQYPAAYDASNIISVAATDANDNLASFSNFGPRTVHLAAPGQSILSTTPNNTYSYADGTSMASPHVAGAAALICSANPNITVERLRAALLFGSEQLTTLSGKVVTGRRLNASGALQSVVENVNDVTPPAINDLRINSQENRNVDLAWTAPGDDGATGTASLYEARFTDQASGAQFLLATAKPATAGTPQSLTVNVPYRHTAGTIILRAIDNAGNIGAGVVNVTINATAADPYTVAQGTPAALSTGGAPLRINYDDAIYGYILPFEFPFFESASSTVNVSTNGALYLPPVAHPNADPLSLSERLSGATMIAGLWDDLNLETARRADADVYVVRPDNDRVIFRWQGVTYDTPLSPTTTRGEHPVNFEIELRRDGTIIKRYGDGNTNLFPVVGIGGGEPEAYLAASHTSEFSLRDLTNAPTLTYTLRRQPPKADLAITGVTVNSTAVMVGQNFTYNISAKNNGPDRAAAVTLTNLLSPFTSFISCTTSRGTCIPPGLAAHDVVVNLGSLDAGASATISIIVNAASFTNSTYDNITTISSPTYDPETANSNRYSVTTSPLQPNPQPITGVSRIGAGLGHSLAVKTDGTVLAWGTNNNSQLGDNTRTDRLVPVRVQGLTGASALTGGYAHSVALRSNGTVWTWGNNQYGQLGDGTNTTRKTPVQVGGLNNITAIAAGSSHTLALRADGTVWAWGNNQNGQLGDGSNVQRATPVQVSGLTGVVSIAAGINHSLAVRTDGTVWTWGGNESGQLGDGTLTASAVPLQASGLTGVVSVACGGVNYQPPSSYSLALRSDGTVWAWGDNRSGQLGDGNFNGRRLPAQVSGLNGVNAISAGQSHALALRSDGTVWGWGSNSSGQLGTGSSSFGPSTPVQVLWLTGITAIACGGEHNLALGANGHIWAWGNGFNGQLGSNYAGGSRPFPFEASQQAPDPAPISTVAAPVFNPDGGAYATPLSVMITSATAGAQLSSINAGFRHTIALMSDGTVWGWGSNSNGQLGFSPVGGGGPLPDPSLQTALLPVQISGLAGTTAIVAGNAHNVALKADGTVWTWGANSFGQLGRGNTVDSPTPTQVAGVSSVTAIAAGGAHTLALKSDGTVWSWGTGQTLNSNSVFDYVTTPRQVTGLSNIVSIAAGGSASYAVRSDGTVWAWGFNGQGQLGDGTFTNRGLPVQVSNLAGAVAVAAGGGHAVALLADGTLRAWGNNQYGQLGTGDINFTPSLTPVQVSNLTGVSFIEAGLDHTVAVKSNGTVWTWGVNFNGEIGDATTMNRPAATQLIGFDGSRIVAGGNHTVAVKPDGTLWTWGKNDSGQLGDGTTETPQTSPAQMDKLAGNVVIHYTTDGNEPTENDPALASGGTVLVNRALTLKAKAWKSGWTASSTRSAGFNITAPNQIDDARFYIRRHYLDFLGREPDQGGLDYWSEQITGNSNNTPAPCPAGDRRCILDRRLNVSAAFFVENEFQRTGSFVYRFYKSSYGTRPTFAQFTSDRSLVPEGPQLEASKQAFADAWVQRAAFLQKYPQSLTGPQFIDALLLTVQQGSGVDLAARRASLLSDYNANQSRARIVRMVADDAAFTNAEYSPSFVLMQYFGYLQRNPDEGGYQFWLDVLNNRVPGNYRAMVCAFLTSTEYQQRFGTTITYINQDCGP
ncbi:MAG TPA: S8 family serine peptidase [Pyrinomonadaceae bacterium]